MTKTIMLAVTCSLLLLIAQGNHVCSADSNADLIAAINSGDAVKVTELLSGGADPNYRSSQAGMTVLMRAAYKGNAEIVNLLLEKGAKVNEKTDNGITALLLAAYNNHIEVVKLLLGKGSDANIRVEKGNNAFEVAALKGYEEVAKLLRVRTKGAADLQIKTVIAPLEEKQKCIPVMKSADEGSEKVGCLKAGVEVSTAGESGDNKWAILQKPVSGWVPMTAIRKVFVTKAQRKPSDQRSSESTERPASTRESGTNSGGSDLTSPGPRDGSWWRRQ